ncbi:MAG TPA: zinc-dependent alcohol dehydrogenase family protein [Terriglobales bacterium]|jgi:propanol-preferring alcohol dehydrogenase|nr:zinc-dependent alcohol dehydrogenase family protein [Terriglobales bacterium]
MRAMVLEQPRLAEENPLELRNLPVPEPGTGEIRIRVRYCGVCHTDLHTVEGDLGLPKLPVVPGHQIVGTVDALGEGVRAFHEGDRVGVPWLYSTCGKCAFCLKSNENLCDFARFTGFHADGGYAEAMVVSESFAYPIPQQFSDADAAPLLCAGIVGYRSLKLSGVSQGELLGLYGFGASAHIVLQLARYKGCEVYVFTRSEAHRRLAKKLGAVWVGEAKDDPQHQLDAAIIFAPAGALLLDALRVLRKGGTVALAGIAMSPIPEMDYSLLYHERVVRSVANSTRDDARELLELAAEIPVQTEIQVFELEQANAALQALKHSRIEGAGVLWVAS